MKCIIAGGRDYRLTDDDFLYLGSLGITEVVSGACSGADKDGEHFAHCNGITVKQFPAKWHDHGKAAGPIRNREMAQYADAVVLFPGGRGTASMRLEAKNAGIQIYDRTAT